ncbi:MAG: hypothetical protein U0992_22155 [Planctomycetaceae bacterium]
MSNESMSETEAADALPPPKAENAEPLVSEPQLSAATQSLLFGLSLPERLVRSAVGLTAGAVKELAGFVVPQAFQSSKSYEIAIQNALSFLTDTVGGAQRRPAEGAATGGDDAGEYVARKAVGNFIDLTGLATLHVSPIWVLAVVSDVCYGTKTYVQEVAEQLKAQGVIDDTSTIHHVDDLLGAIQKASGTTASAFDTPPLSIAQLKRTIDETREALSQADVLKLIPQSELAAYWNEMQSVAHAEGVSLLDVSTAITMNTLNRVKTVTLGALTSVQVAGGLFNRNVFGHYRDSLTRISEHGLFATVAESYQPYVDAVWRNFSTEKRSWTETLLDPRNVTRGWDKVWRMMGSRE